MSKITVKCTECNRKNYKNSKLYFIKWISGKYTCNECVELAYHLLKAESLMKITNK